MGLTTVEPGKIMGSIKKAKLSKKYILAIPLANEKWLKIHHL